MSFQVFLADLKKEPLTIDRLEKIFNNSNYKGKSPLIDPLTAKLYEVLRAKAQQLHVPEAQVSLTEVHVTKICDMLLKAQILELIPAIDPHLVLLPSNVRINDDWRLNEATGLIFKPISKDTPDPRQWVATRVLIDGRLYPLGMKHINVAISNGWLFESNLLAPNSCPFQISN